MYDYRQAMREDIRDYIEENKDQYDFSDRDSVESELYDDMFIDDSVTGNGSGSYTFNAQEAKENIDLDLLADACDEFGGGEDILRKGWEAMDVTIRCYLLGEILSDVLNELYADDYFGTFEDESLKESVDESDTVCGYPISGTTVMTGDEFDKFMDKVIGDSKE